MLILWLSLVCHWIFSNVVIYDIYVVIMIYIYIIAYILDILSTISKNVILY